MTDPNLSKQPETEKAELDAILATDDPTLDETPPAPVKLYYKAKRHDRRRAAAKARKQRRKK